MTDERMRSFLMARVRERLRDLQAQPDTALDPSYYKHVEQVIVIASSPRGGSSVIAELLRRRAPELLQPNGETVPHLALARLRYPDVSSGSDWLDGNAPPDGVEYIRAALGRELGFRVRRLDGAARARFAVDLTCRLTMQWPNETFEVSEVGRYIEDACTDLTVEHGWEKYEFRDAQAFHVAFLRRLTRDHPGIDPLYYDWTLTSLRRYWSGWPLPLGPPGDVLVEMPPFLLTWPRRCVTIRQVSQLPLLLKTSSDAYRLDFIRRLFPRSMLRIVHLVRNPAACVNGLIDGWLHRGFFAVRVADPELAIAGYSNRYPLWGRSWWKFDLPPGWRQMTDRSLPEICAFQWASAHEAIRDHLARTDADHFQVRFEDLEPALQGGPLPPAFVDWLSRGNGCSVAASGTPMEPVMATVKPDPHRWRARRAIIEPVLATDQVAVLARALGYHVIG